MINGSHSIVGDKLMQGLAMGLAKAAQAFSQMVNAPGSTSDFHCGNHDVNLLSFDAGYQRYSKIPRHLLTTEIFGDVTGKCYLYLSQHDYAFVTRNIPEARPGSVNLREEFIKELDNILSATVISQLSNLLNRKMYGDVPVLVGQVQSRLEDVIYDDFNDQSDEVYINTSYFTFDGVENVSPLFVWVFDSSVVSQNNKTEAV
ncbi:MAG: hypothetical protein ACOYW3_03330 [Bacteroidota bacterium]